MKNKVVSFFQDGLFDSIMTVILFSFGSIALALNMLIQKSLSSLVFKASFAIVFVWFFIKIIILIIESIRNHKKIAFKDFCLKCVKDKELKILSTIALFFVFSLFFSLISTKFHISGFSYFNQIICVFVCFLLYYLFHFSKIHKNAITIALIINLALALFTIVLFLTGKARTWHNTTSWVDLNLNFQNPNPAGEYCLVVFLLLVGSAFFFKNIILKVLSAATAIVMFFFMNLTSSRNPFVALILALIIVIILYFIKKNTKNIACLSIVIPIVYIFVIMLFGFVFDRTGAFKNLLEGIEFFGRYYLWSEYFDSFTTSPIVGCYFLVGPGGDVSSFVNSYIMVLILFGPLCYVLFLLFLYQIVSSLMFNTKNGTKSIVSMFPVFCFLSILYLGLNEGGVFVGVNGLYILGIFCSVIFDKIDIRERFGAYESTHFEISI